MARLGAVEEIKPLDQGELELLKTLAALARRLPFSQFQYVQVTFSATADGDTDIVHQLQPPTPEDIDFQVVRWEFGDSPAAPDPAMVYRDSSPDRRPWGAGYIVLRCTEASAVATLLLTVRQSRDI